MNRDKSQTFSLQLPESRWLPVAAALALLLAGGCGKVGGQVDSNRFSTLGMVMAEKSAQLCPEHGSMVLVVSKNDSGQSTPYGLAFESFRKALGNKVTVGGTEIVPTPKALGPGMDPLSADQFAELLQKHSGVDCLVFFIRVPALTTRQIAQLPSPRPQVVAMIPNPQLTRAMFSGKVLGLAVMAKPGEPEAAAGGSLQQQFDAQYQLVTLETSGQLAR